MIEITLDFDKRFEGEIPEAATYSGIYVVYAYNGDTNAPKWSLLDIGQANNVSERHSTHERKGAWEAYAKKHKMKLIFYTAEINNEHNYRDIAEAALLYKYQPMCATDGKSGYHHGDARIMVVGCLKNAFGEFSVRNTDK